MSETKQQTTMTKLPSSKEIAKATYECALSCYGITGVVKYTSLATNDFTPLDEDNFSGGIVVRKHAKDTFSVDVYVTLANQVKVSVILFEAQKVIRYSLNKKFGQRCRHVNLYAMAIAN